MAKQWRDTERDRALDGLKLTEREFLKRAVSLLATKLEGEQKKLTKDFDIESPEIEEMLRIYHGTDHDRGLKELFLGQRTIHEERDLRLAPEPDADTGTKKGRARGRSKKKDLDPMTVTVEAEVTHPAGPVPARKALGPGTPVLPAPKEVP